MSYKKPNDITTINYEYKDGKWKVWITYEPIVRSEQPGSSSIPTGISVKK